MAAGEIEIKIGKGRESCTTELRYHKCDLRNNGECVIFIDTVGLDDTEDLHNNTTSENNLATMREKLMGEKNILVVIFVVSRVGEISGTVIETFRSYIEFLGLKQDKQSQINLFKGIVSRCDFDESPEDEFE
jgi:hypothetical protein